MIPFKIFHVFPNPSLEAMLTYLTLLCAFHFSDYVLILEWRAKREENI